MDLPKTTNSKTSSTEVDTGKKDRRRRLLRALFSSSMAILLLFLVYRKTNFSDLLSQLEEGGIAWFYILLSIFIEASANTLRGIRWQQQMLPLAPPIPRKRVVVATMWGCYSVNLVLPRAGEIWRCWEVSRREKLSLSAIFGTLVAERFMDIVVMAFLFIFAWLLFPLQTRQLTAFMDLPTRLEALVSNPWFYLATALLVLFLILLRKRIAKSSVGEKVRVFIRSFAGGILTIVRMPRRWLFLMLTLIIYGLYFLGFYITFYAFPFTQEMGLGVGFLAFLMATLGVAVPVQGGIGPWHFMCITTLVAFGVSRDDAGLFALVVHTVQTFGIALLGLLAIWGLPLFARKKKNQLKHP